MSEDNKFPIMKDNDFEELISLLVGIVDEYPFDRYRLQLENVKKIPDWFKRCIEDYPTMLHDTTHSTKGVKRTVSRPHRLTRKWFGKWFGQFNEKEES